MLTFVLEKRDVAVNCSLKHKDIFLVGARKRPKRLKI